MILERKILRCITGMYRRADGKWHSNAILYEKAGVEPLEREAEKMHTKHQGRREEHLNEFFRGRVEDLTRRRQEMVLRNWEFNNLCRQERDEKKWRRKLRHILDD